MTTFRLFLFATALSAVWLSRQTASNVNFLSQGLILAALITLPIQLYCGYQKRFYWGHWQAPFARHHRKHWLSIGNKLFALGIVWWALNLATVTVQHTRAEFLREITIYLVCLIILATSALCIQKHFDWLLNLFVAIVAIFMSVEVYRTLVVPPVTESVVLRSPFKQTFYVIDGGNSHLVSIMKVQARSARSYAIYLIATDQAFAPEQRAEPYPHTFGEVIVAPASGKVIQIVDGVSDAPEGVFSKEGGPGNYVYIKINEAQYLILAHLKNGSLLVEEGDQVVSGQPIAQAGKSGSTSIPALFMAVHTKEDLFAPDNMSYPLYFDHVTRSGTRTKKPPFFATRNDLFHPIESPSQNLKSNDALPHITD